MGVGSKWSTLGSSEPQKANGGGDGDGSCSGKNARQGTRLSAKCGGGGGGGEPGLDRKQLLTRSSDQLVESIGKS